MIKQAVVVISGYNTRAVVAFCRWAAANGVRFHIIAKCKEDPIFQTVYKENIGFTRDSPQLHINSFRKWIDVLCRQYGYQKVIILPSTEYLNRYLLENRTAIESQNGIIPLVNERLYRKISDKLSFAKLCQSYGLDVPAEYNEIPENLPFVAKPRSYFSGKGDQLVPHIIRDAQDLDIFHKNEDQRDYFFQQYMYGRSLYLLAYIGKPGSDNNVVFSQENLMQQARGGSIILAKASGFHQSEMAKNYVAMLQEQKFFGLVMVEVRLDETNGRYYMIEANPRLWGPMQFCVDNGVDLFSAMFRDYGFEIPDRHTSVDSIMYYYWSGGITHQSQPVAYHNYSSDEFVKNFQELRSQDIFARKDTLSLYMKELNMRGESE